jgi:hypothetical protein
MLCITNGWVAAMLKNLDTLVLLLGIVAWGGWCVLGHHVGPKSRFRSPISEHLIRNRGKMVHQTEINRRQGAPLRLWVHAKLRERELSRLSPEFDGGLDLGRPEQVGLLGRLRRFRHHGSRAIHVVAADLVLGAVAAGLALAHGTQTKTCWCLPLRECFITANMPPLARLASLSRLGMAAP